LLHRAQALFQLADYNGAVADCDQALAKELNYVEALACRAACFLRMGLGAEAVKDLSIVLRINDDDTQSYYQRGLARFSLGDYKEAKVDFNHAQRLAPRWALVYLARARTHRALGDTTRADADLAEA